MLRDVRALVGRLVLGFLVLACVLGGAREGRAQNAKPGAAGPTKAVPPELAPWVPWVLEGREAAMCPSLPHTATMCAWPARLELSLDEKGGKFVQTWHLEATQWVPLPGDAKRWPLDVKDGATGATVVNREGPRVRLERGDHVLTGSFAWDAMPESLRVPKETGLVSLVLRGKPVASPNRDESGTVWLQKAAKNEEGDALELVVHRKVVDEIPLLLVTRIEVHASGKNREELLGRALPDGFVPVSLESPLPARLEPDGHVRVQLRPGVFTLELTARSEGPVQKLARPAPGGPWREGDEVWVFDARNDFRVVTVEGVPSIDPSQTTLPDAWKRLPAYPMKLTDTFSLVEKRRGDADPPPNQLALVRKLWLDFDGRGFTVHDQVNGTLSRDSRLTMASPTLLGRVAIDGKDQFITKLDGKEAKENAGAAGVEIRQGELRVTADSRIPTSPTDVPAVSWAHDFHQVRATLALPPGFRLLHASGVDDVPDTWVRHWSLLELFLALVLTVAIGRLYGPRWSAVALVFFALAFPETGAPKWCWVPALVLEAVLRVIPKGSWNTRVGWVRTAAVLVIAIVAVPFLVQHVREGVYPALASPSIGEDESMASFDNKEGGTGTRAKGEEGSMGNPNVAMPAAPPVQVAASAQNAPVAPNAQNTVDEPAQDVSKLEPEKDKNFRDAEQKKPSPMPGKKWGSSSAGYRSDMQSNAAEYDPTAIVQTGPGLPRWNWTLVELHFSGPVTAAQRMHLYLSSPSENLVLALLRAALLVVLLLRLFPFTQRYFPGGWGKGSSDDEPTSAAKKSGGASVATTAIALLAFVLALFAGDAKTARAEPPSQAMLDELQKRMLTRAECEPSCTESGRMLLEVRGDVLRARIEVDAAASAAFALPGSIGQFTPRDVLVDGQPAKALVRGDDGRLFTLLAPGKHQVVLEGPMPERESMQLALPTKPHHVQAIAEGWTVEGVHEDGLADDNLQLTRKRTEGAGKGTTLQPGSLPPFVRVERTLRMGLNWQVDTRVVRLSPVGSAVVLEVPLLPGENVTTADVRVSGGKALVNMSPQLGEVSWHSVLEQRTPIELVAPKATTWTEVWRTDVGPVWHATYGGIPFVHTQPVAGVRFPEWRPWPGERATIDLVRPGGIPGQTLTLDESRLEISPGIRATDSKLTLSLRGSRGAQHTVTLPEGAVLESLLVNGATQPIRQDGRKVTFQVVPGSQSVVLGYREERGTAFFFRASEVDVGLDTVNSNVTFMVPGGRWLLFTGGPRLGPAVLFWSLLAVLLVVAVVLGRNKKTPLVTWHWLLLAVGLSQVHIVLAAFFVGWLVALGYREKNDGTDMAPGLFNLRQIALVGLTLMAVGVLFASIYKGLLGDPEMQVRGNMSSLSELRWFQDRGETTLPTPWMISAPLLVYRALMLAWALWTALAVVRWLRWGFQAFTTGGAWKKSPPRPATPPRGAYGQAFAGPMPQGAPVPQGAYPQPQQGQYPQEPGTAPQAQAPVAENPAMPQSREGTAQGPSAAQESPPAKTDADGEDEGEDDL